MCTDIGQIMRRICTSCMQDQLNHWITKRKFYVRMESYVQKFMCADPMRKVKNLTEKQSGL